MNGSAAEAVRTVNGWVGQFRPVWASSFRQVQINGRPAYFMTAEAAECAAWRILYRLEQRVMRREGEIIFAAKSAAHQLFRKTVEVERKETAA